VHISENFHGSLGQGLSVSWITFSGIATQQVV